MAPVNDKMKRSQIRSTFPMGSRWGITKKRSHGFNGVEKQFNHPSRNHSSGFLRSHFSGPQRSQFNGGQNFSQLCAKCGGLYQENCLICYYKYWNLGHVFRFCEEGSTVIGKVFALSPKEVWASPTLSKSFLKLQGHKIDALFDSDATHSFISYDCMHRLKLIICELPHEIIVSTPAETSERTTKACLKCTIECNGRISITNLVCLPMKGFDLIMGKDWLLANDFICGVKGKTISLLVDSEF